MRERAKQIATWIIGVLSCLCFSIIPVGAGHGGALLGEFLFLGWGEWLPVTLPMFVGFTLLAVVFPFVTPPRANWLALVGVLLLCAVLLLLQVFMAQFVRVLLVAAIPFAVIGSACVVLNVRAILRDRRVA